MKFLKIFSIPLAALFLLTSCSQPEKKDSIGFMGAATDSIDVTGSATDSADVTGATTDRVRPWEEDPIYSMQVSRETDLGEYNGEELTVTMSVESRGQSFEQAFFLYVNGEINEYGTDEYPEKKFFHVYSVPEEGRIEVTMHFTPYNCKKGEKAAVVIASMLNPNYMFEEEDLAFCFFRFHHSLVGGGLSSELSINQDSPESEYNKISTDFIKAEITEEYKKEHKYDITNEEGESRLEGNNYFNLYQEKYLEGYYTAENELTINIDACGTGGKFLVGIYINHELQKAFGDNYYAVCDIERDYLTSITAHIDVSKLSKANHIYLVAAPYDIADAKEEKYGLYKTDTLILMIGDKDEIDAEMEKGAEKIKADYEASKDRNRD